MQCGRCWMEVDGGDRRAVAARWFRLSSPTAPPMRRMVQPSLPVGATTFGGRRGCRDGCGPGLVTLHPRGRRASARRCSTGVCRTAPHLFQRVVAARGEQRVRGLRPQLVGRRPARVRCPGCEARARIRGVGHGWCRRLDVPASIAKTLAAVPMTTVAQMLDPR